MSDDCRVVPQTTSGVEGRTPSGHEEKEEIMTQKTGMTVAGENALTTEGWRGLLTTVRGMYPKASDEEFGLLVYQANRTNLDPLARQIFLVPRYDSKAGKFVSTIQTGIDGYRAISSRAGNDAGIDEPLYDEGRTQFEMIAGGRSKPTTATVTVYKLVSGVRVPYKATAEWSAYCPGKDAGAFMWKKMPFLMLAKCAEALARRMAWPDSLSGVYVDAEMHQANGVVEAEEVTAPKVEAPKIEAPKPQEKKKDPPATSVVKKDEPPSQPSKDAMNKFRDIPKMMVEAKDDEQRVQMMKEIFETLCKNDEELSAAYKSFHSGDPGIILNAKVFNAKEAVRKGHK